MGRSNGGILEGIEVGGLIERRLAGLPVGCGMGSVVERGDVVGVGALEVCQLRFCKVISFCMLASMTSVASIGIEGTRKGWMCLALCICAVLRTI